MEIEENEASVAHGRKRPPQDELTGEQRLTKRFHLLNLENARQLYIPTQQRSPTRRLRSNAVSNPMDVEETKNRVYIHDLDEELEGIESDEERLIFLPDIEKRLANLPKSILTTETAPKGNEMILYNVPQSLTVSREHDNVRKAIIESRARARASNMDDIVHNNIGKADQDEPRDETGSGGSGEALSTDKLEDDAMDTGD